MLDHHSKGKICSVVTSEFEFSSPSQNCTGQTFDIFISHFKIPPSAVVTIINRSGELGGCPVSLIVEHRSNTSRIQINQGQQLTLGFDNVERISVQCSSGLPHNGCSFTITGQISFCKCCQ